MSDTERHEIEPLLTVEDVAEWLRFRPNTIRQWVKLDLIPYVKVARSTRFRRSEVEQWFAAGRPGKAA